MAATIVEHVRNSVTLWTIEKNVVGCACSIVWRCRGCITCDCCWDRDCGATSITVRDGCGTREVLRRHYCRWDELGSASDCLVVRSCHASWGDGAYALNCDSSIIYEISSAHVWFRVLKGRTYNQYG
jgi:hypothetical protein